MGQLPPLSGYNQNQAIKIRKAYLRYLNTYGFTSQRVSRLDFGLHINLLEKQLNRIFITSEKYALEDMIYEKYLEPKNGGYYIKPICIGYGVVAIDMLKTTDQWLDIHNRVQCFELLIRCIMYDFKRSQEFKEYLSTILYRPRFFDSDTVY